MKKFAGILSLIIVLGTEVLTPITYATDAVMSGPDFSETQTFSDESSSDTSTSSDNESDNSSDDSSETTESSQATDNTQQEEIINQDNQWEEENGDKTEGSEQDEPLSQDWWNNIQGFEHQEVGDQDNNEEPHWVTSDETPQSDEVIQCEDSVPHGIYNEECVFQNKCEEWYVLEENEEIIKCVLMITDNTQEQTAISGNTDNEAEKDDEEIDKSFFENLSDIAKEIISGIRYFFKKDNDSYIKYSSNQWTGIIVLEDPENGEIITIMDKNIGATSKEIDDESSYGNYYQWWNNYGFETVDETNSTSDLATFEDDYTKWWYSDDQFRLWDKDIWEENENHDLWFDWEEEIQWPCPDGYHVPTQKEWNKLLRIWTKIHTHDIKETTDEEGNISTNKKVRSTESKTLETSLEKCDEWDIDNEGNCIKEDEFSDVANLFLDELKLPRAGAYDKNGVFKANRWIYWTATPWALPYQSEVFSVDTYFWADLDDDEKDRVVGHSVRCFLDTKVKEKVISDIYNKEEITWAKTYDGVTVSVYAWTWFFPEGTQLQINAIEEDKEINDIKDQISEKDDIEENAKLVAFDISFIYKWEEVQPLEWKIVKVTFDYSGNNELLEADKDEEQSVKVYHIDDKDDAWEYVEEGEEQILDVTNVSESEEVWIVVADAEKFSVYAVIATSGDWLKVTYNLSWWYWMEDGSMDPKTITYTGTKTTMLFRTPSKTGYMFMWWFDESLTTRRDWNVTDGMNVYAKWQEFWDLDIYILKDNSTKNHYTFMDRNMWATELYDKVYCNKMDTECISNRNNYASYGYYYQWWNNYGFASYAENSGALSNITTGNKQNVTSYSREKPYTSTIFAGTSSEDWVSWTYNNLWWWNESNVAHRQWPCPDWYHVPNVTEREKIRDEWNVANYRDVLHNFHIDLLLPAASYRSRKDRKVDRTAFHHYRYLTSTYKKVWGDKNDDNEERNLVTLDEKTSNGYSVRCIKNVENTNSTVFDMSNIDLRWWEKAIISIVSWEVVSLQKPIRNINDEFRWWYTTSDYSWNPIWIWSGFCLNLSWDRWIIYVGFVVKSFCNPWSYWRQ